MHCHECAAIGLERTAVSICRFCSVALCKDHLVTSFRSTTATLYTCDHHPERPYAVTPIAVRNGAITVAGRSVRS